MEIKVKASTMVKPLTPRPSTTLWLSNLDLIMPQAHTDLCYFYRSTGAADFFDTTLLKEALSRALVEFYPMAGRLQKDSNGRTEINCNGEGALFVEAESDGTLDDLGDFRPRPELRLIPTVDYSQGISAYPLLLVQVTRFKCGGVCIGKAMHHSLVDGTSGFLFVSTWAELSRGLEISTRPFWERREVLSVRTPPMVQFNHLEYQPHFPLELEPSQNHHEPLCSMFELTPDHLKALKQNGSTVSGCSTFKALAGHLWRCVTEARALPEHQETKLYIPVNGRQRMRPPLPQGYIGNVTFLAMCSALCGELVSNPLEFAVDKIRGAIGQMDDEYLRSAVDYLELRGDRPALEQSPFQLPNLGINSWMSFPVYDADFGWGRPGHVGLCRDIPDGIPCVFPTRTGEGLLVGITLPKEQMQVFSRVFYRI